MRVIYNRNGTKKQKSDLTLAEQNENRLFLEDEDTGNSETIINAKIEEVEECEQIGIIEFNQTQVEYIDNSRIPEPVDNCLFLQGVLTAEQRGNQVYVEFSDGEKTQLTGEFDRAYTY